MSVEAESWRALGTGVHVLVSDGDRAAAVDAVRRVLVEVDLAYSRFRPDSELSRVNAAGGRPQVIGTLFADAVEAGLRAAQLTEGRVDPTVGRAMRAIGYDRDFDQLGSRTDPLSIRLEPVPGWRTIDFDRAARRLRLARGVELDLGSTGKALAADIAVGAAMAATGRGGVLVSLGGDIATAGTAPRGGWRVLAAEDSATRPSSDGEVIAIEGGAIATSSTTVRTWQRGGVSVHHLIDPKTGGPVDSPWRTVSVVAASCVDANTAATAAIVAGASGLEWLDRLGLAARLVATDGDIYRVGQWPGATQAA